MAEKFTPVQVEFEAIQCTESNHEEVAALVRVPGAVKSWNGGIRFGLNGAWKTISPGEWAVRFGTGTYDHSFLEDHLFKAMFHTANKPTKE